MFTSGDVNLLNMVESLNMGNTAQGGGTCLTVAHCGAPLRAEINRICQRDVCKRL